MFKRPNKDYGSTKNKKAVKGDYRFLYLVTELIEKYEKDPGNNLFQCQQDVQQVSLEHSC